MDIFSVKPIDSESIVTHAKKCSGKIIVVEDHYPEGEFRQFPSATRLRGAVRSEMRLIFHFFFVGGIGDAVASAVANEDDIKVVAHLCVRDLPRSGPPSVLLDMFKISSSAIQEAVLANV